MSTKRKRVSESPVVEAKTPASSKRRRGANNNQERTIEQLRQCQELLDYLKTVKHEGRGVLEHFMRNPSKRSDPEYYKEVENPIDVTRIQQKMRNEDYTQMSQFFDDMTLLIENALAYYKDDTEEHTHAVELERVYGEKKRLIENGEEWKLNGDVKKEELMDEETRSASPSARSAGTRSSTGDASIDEAVAEDILATIIEQTDEHKRLISPPFRVLQSMEEFPLYYEKISMPIDLKTIAEKTRAGCYTNMAALEADINLLVNNAKVFNEPGSTIHTDADTILKVFTKKKNDAGHGRAIGNKRREHCREVVDALIAQSSSEEDEQAYSEDSEEDEDLATSSEWGWQLYWAVRNEQAEGSDESLVSDPFVELPSKSYYPDYYDEIKCPMSLFMINKNLKMGKYSSLDELVRDFALVFGNAMEYNVEASDIYKAARVLKALTLSKAKQLQPTFDVARWSSFRPPTQDNASAEVKVMSSTPAAKTPKSKVAMRVKEEPMDEDMMSESSETPPPSKRKNRRQKPISTGFTPLPDCKPGRKSMDELMLRFRMKLLHFWNLVYDYKGPHAGEGNGPSSAKRKGASHQEEAYWPAGAFVDLPDRKQWRDYYEVIEQPLSLSMIKDKIETNQYESSTELLADFHIMFKNAKTYNEPGSDLHRDASRLEKMVSDAHAAVHDAPYESPVILKEKMGWIKTKMPMYSSKSKAPMATGAADSPPNSGPGAPGTPHRSGHFALPRVPSYDDDDSNSGSSIRSPAPSSSSTKGATPAGTANMPSYRPKIPIKERMEKLPEEGKKMYELLFALKGHNDETGRNVTAAFHKLPSKLELPSYYEVIKKPLDFARIQQKLTCQYYRSPADLVADFKLMFDNACKYNEPESQIYKDAITMQRVLLEKKKEFFSRAGGETFSAQVEIKSMLVTIFVAVFNKKEEEEGRCHSDSFADLVEMMRAKSIPEADFPFSFEQIKRNIDKGRYRRLDRFQSDFFHLFSMARRVARSDSTLFEDAAALQMEFIRMRDETCKALLHSNAYTVLGKDIAEAIEAERKAKTAEENEQERKEEERGSENAQPSQVNGASAKDGESLDSVTVDGVEYSDGDYALVSPSEKDVKEPHLMRIERMWKDGEGATLVTGRWYFRPHETYHLATKKFADNEVFLTNFRDTVTSDRLMTKAAIVQPKQWCKYTVKGFEPENVFVCEERYLGKTLHFKKIKIWPFPQDDELFELEERPTALNLTRTPREVRKGANGLREDDESSQSSQESAEEDERCSGVSVLDVDRPEITVAGSAPGPDADGRTYFQQMTDKSGRTFYLGNFVLVFNHLKPFCDVMRVDKLWRESDGAEFFSGGWFARPTDLYHDLSHLFLKNEVFAVVQSDQTHRLDEVQAKCAVLPVKQFLKERPTEIPECDVFVCESRIVGHLDEATTSNGTGAAPATSTASDCSLFVNPVAQDKGCPPMNVLSAQKFMKLKSYALSLNLAEEEIFLFRQPLTNMEKEPSPVLMKTAIEDLEMDESALSETDPTDSAEAKELVQWLSHQPKLTAKSKSGYILFSAEIRKRIMAENPDAGFGEVSKIVGVEWKKLTEEQKKQYEVRAEYIASERAKQDAANIAAGKTVPMAPGHVRVYVCKWTNCDFQFDCAEGLAEHVILYHTSQIIVDSENQYVCMWLTCLRNRKEGKPFPSLPRLHRHIKEKHVGSSCKTMAPNGRSRNYFKLVAAENGGQPGGAAQLIQFPFGMHPSQAPPGALIQNSHGGQPGIHPMGPPGGGVQPPQAMMNGHHPQAGPDGHMPPHGTPVRVNGVDPRYHQTPAGPMQHQGMPHGHNYAATMQQTPQGPHHAAHPGQHPQHPQQHHPGMQQPQPGHHPQQQQMAGPMADARTVITLGRNAVEPNFVPPPSSVHTRRVLHSETYLRYIESLSNARQRSVSQFDRSLRAHPRNTQTNPNRLPANWLRESRGNQQVKEDEVVRALWRLREELLESTVAVERDYAGVL